VRHGFTLRSGGVSEGKRSSLDLGPSSEVGPDVRENRDRLARAAGFPVERLVLAEQVHGVTVAHHDGIAVLVDHSPVGRFGTR